MADRASRHRPAGPEPADAAPPSSGNDFGACRGGEPGKPRSGGARSGVVASVLTVVVMPVLLRVRRLVMLAVALPLESSAATFHSGHDGHLLLRGFLAHHPLSPARVSWP
jgi:hypothetical protein